MSSGISKLLFLAVAPFLPISAMAQQVPVIDARVDASVNAVSQNISKQTEAMNSNASATTEAINASNKVLGTINQALANALVNMAKTAETIKQSRRNSELYDPSMGSKPQSSCGILSSTAAVANGDREREQIRKNLATVSTSLLETSKNSLPEENMSDRNAFRLKKQLIAEAQIEEVHGTIGLAEHSGIPVSEGMAPTWAVLHQKMLNMAIPNPVELPSNVDDPNQSPIDAVENAKKIAQLNRQKLIAELLADIVSGRTKTYQAEWVKDILFKAEDGTHIGADPSLLAELEKGVSKNDVDRILSGYRLRNPQWVTHTSGQANEVGLMRDANLMQAQALDLLHSILNESRRSNQLLTFIYAHRIEQSGPPQ